MDDIYKELDEIRTRLIRVRATMELEADRPQSGYVASENMDSRERNARRSAIAESLASRPTVEPNFPDNARFRTGVADEPNFPNNARFRTGVADEPNFPNNARFRTDADKPMRLVLPLESFDEEIAVMTRRLLQAADTLLDHTNRVLGLNHVFDTRADMVTDRPAGALDRITESIGALEGAVIYIEGEVNRATGLA